MSFKEWCDRQGLDEKIFGEVKCIVCRRNMRDIWIENPDNVRKAVFLDPRNSYKIPYPEYSGGIICYKCYKDIKPIAIIRYRDKIIAKTYKYFYTINHYRGNIHKLMEDLHKSIKYYEKNEIKYYDIKSTNSLKEWTIIHKDIYAEGYRDEENLKAFEKSLAKVIDKYGIEWLTIILTTARPEIKIYYLIVKSKDLSPGKYLLLKSTAEILSKVYRKQHDLTK